MSGGCLGGAGTGVLVRWSYKGGGEVRREGQTHHLMGTIEAAEVDHLVRTAIDEPHEEGTFML